MLSNLHEVTQPASKLDSWDYRLQTPYASLPCCLQQTNRGFGHEFESWPDTSVYMGPRVQTLCDSVSSFVKSELLRLFLRLNQIINEEPQAQYLVHQTHFLLFQSSFGKKPSVGKFLKLDFPSLLLSGSILILNCFNLCI